MATPKWDPGKLYPPGSIVVPRTAPSATWPALANAGFEDGNLGGWVATKYGTGTESASTGRPFTGSYAARWLGSSGGPAPGGASAVELLNEVEGTVRPGQSVTVSAVLAMDDTGNSQNRGYPFIAWFNSSDALISTSRPPESQWVAGNYSNYTSRSFSAQAPAGASYARMGVWLAANNEGGMWADQCSWTSNPPPATSGLLFRAVQPTSGYSDTSEPVWPGSVGLQVIDNEVVWEAILMSRVVWQARAILKSGATEPDWPTEHGALVSDGTISWEAVDLRITDPNCPNSKVVVIAKSKIYAGGGDVVRYSATLNPRDWTLEQDAGYLGTGLMQNGANYVAVLNLYRGNLIVMNSATFQQWNIDPDPALMDLLDTMDGVGSIHHLAATPVANDLFYLASLGVRTIGISGATNNLRAGDVGLPVDPMIQERAREAVASGIPPLGMYYPSSGQYWLVFTREAFNDGSGVSPIEVCPTLQVGDRYAEVFVYTLNQTGQVGAWTRYIFPFAIDYAAQKGDDLFVRDGDTVYRLSELIGACDFYDPGDSETPESGAPFNGVIWWPHLDFGSPQDKTMEGFDIVGYGDSIIEVGYNQRDPLAFTEPYSIIADTLDGTPIPLTVTAPSMSFRLTYPGWDPADPAAAQQRHWGFNALVIDPAQTQ